jgi:hypothetical protein
MGGGSWSGWVIAGTSVVIAITGILAFLSSQSPPDGVPPPDGQGRLLLSEVVPQWNRTSTGQPQIRVFATVSNTGQEPLTIGNADVAVALPDYSTRFLCAVRGNELPASSTDSSCQGGRTLATAEVARFTFWFYGNYWGASLEGVSGTFIVRDNRGEISSIGITFRGEVQW